MLPSLCSSFAGLALAGGPKAGVSFRTQPDLGAIRGAGAPKRLGPTYAVAVQARQNSLRRQRTAEKARLRNKSRKTEVKNRIKKALLAAEGARVQLPTAESDLRELDACVSAAYKAIDKATSKGVLHDNAAARRKARVAKARQQVLIAAGLYTPPLENGQGEDEAGSAGV